jgi:Domain of unknown function (DUF4159)
MRFRWLLLASLCLTWLAPPASAATLPEIQTAVEHAESYLYSQLNIAGTWETTPRPMPGAYVADTTGGQWGGLTALATCALLDAGENPRNPHLAPAIEFLKTAPIRGIYALALRAQVWALLAGRGDQTLHAYIQRDGNLLVHAMKTDTASAGLYGYLTTGGLSDPTHLCDHSVSQFGVLGVWSLQETGLEVPDEYWSTVDSAWRRDQCTDGGWSYLRWPQPDQPETATFAAAGLATLFITDEYLRNPWPDSNIQHGLDWLGAHFDSTFASPNHPCYALFGVERAATASGLVRLSGTDWFQRGADFLMQTQSSAGAWAEQDGNVADTALGLLFLIHGRAPIIMSKLNYSTLTKTPAWNRRPRDLDHLARWIKRTIESYRPLNWQTVTFEDSLDDWHNAPILLVCGNAALDFSEQDKAKLKQFVEEGGMILFNSDGANNAAFTESARRMGENLFGGKFRELPANHPIFANEEFHRSRWPTPPTVLGLSNGARELMLLIPDADLSIAWQDRASITRPEAFELGTDIFLYAVDKQHLRYRGQTYLVKPDAAITATRTIRIARLFHDGNWNPEPGGWRRLAAVMHNHDVVDLDVALGIHPGDGSLRSGEFDVAHLTGTTIFSLSDNSRRELRQFVNSGGTLIVDAAGGSPDFAQSALGELKKIFPGQADQLSQPFPIHSPVYSEIDGLPSLRQINNRLYAGKILGYDRHPRLCGMQINGRIAVYFSAEDISVGLVGQSVDGIVGYDPDTATALMERMLLNAGRK